MRLKWTRYAVLLPTAVVARLMLPFIERTTGGHMKTFRQVVAILVLTRVCTSLALILVEGASDLLQAASFTIALIGIAPVGLVITGMSSGGRADSAARREPGRRNSWLATAR